MSINTINKYLEINGNQIRSSVKQFLPCLLKIYIQIWYKFFKTYSLSTHFFQTESQNLPIRISTFKSNNEESAVTRPANYPCRLFVRYCCETEGWLMCSSHHISVTWGGYNGLISILMAVQFSFSGNLRSRC